MTDQNNVHSDRTRNWVTVRLGFPLSEMRLTCIMGEGAPSGADDRCVRPFPWNNSRKRPICNRFALIFQSAISNVCCAQNRTRQVSVSVALRLLVIHVYVNIAFEGLGDFIVELFSKV